MTFFHTSMLHFISVVLHFTSIVSRSKQEVVSCARGHSERSVRSHLSLAKFSLASVIPSLVSHTHTRVHCKVKLFIRVKYKYSNRNATEGW